MHRKDFRFVLQPLFLLVMILPILGEFLIHYFAPTISWEHEPLHAAFEVLGSVIALMLAYHLLRIFHKNHELTNYLWVACALTGMGLLDGFHALVYPGVAFVWLHSTAVLVGGLFIVMVWLPGRFACRRLRSHGNGGSQLGF